MKGTYVLNLRKIIKFILSALFIFVFILVVFSDKFINGALSYAKEYAKESETLINVMPTLSLTNKELEKKDNLFFDILINENLKYPEKVIANELTSVSGIKDKIVDTYAYVNESNLLYVPKILQPKNEQLPVLPNIQEKPTLKTSVNSIKNNGTLFEKKGITLKNATAYSLNLDELYKTPLSFNKNKNNEPQVLIVHTHGSEGYNPTDRNQDINNNIVRVGNEMETVFNKNGISVIHSEVMHDIPKFNNSYRQSLKTIEETLKKNPSIQVVLDVHRDAMIKSNGEVFKVVTNVDNKQVAQMMFVVGTNEGGLKHDNWKQNLNFAMKCQEKINGMYPNLARPIDLRTERFNQHATAGSLIIEVGTNGNTLEEAVLTGRYTAEAISKVLNELK